MVIHNTLTGSELHDPKGVYDTGAGASNPVDLPAAATAYLINFDTGNAAVTIDTTNDRITLGNATDTTDVDLQFGAAGELRLDGAAGTSGYVLTSQGANVPPIWAAAAAGSLPFTITDNTSSDIVDDGTNGVLAADLTNGAEVLTYGHNADSAVFTHQFYGTAISLYGDLTTNDVTITRGDGGAGGVTLTTSGAAQFLTLSTSGASADLVIDAGGTTSDITVDATQDITVTAVRDLRLTSTDNMVFTVDDNNAVALRVATATAFDYIIEADTTTGAPVLSFGNTGVRDFDFSFLGAGDLALPTGALLDGSASAGTSGYVLTSTGTSTAWAAASGGASTLPDLTDVTFAVGAAQGDVLYRGATDWNNLAAGTANYGLITQGAAANPTWAQVALTTNTMTMSNKTLTSPTINTATWGTSATSSAAFTYNIQDNTASAFLIQDSFGDDQLLFNTTTGSEAITIGNATTNPDINIPGNGPIVTGATHIQMNTASDGQIFLGDPTVAVTTDGTYIGGGTADLVQGTGGTMVGHDTTIAASLSTALGSGITITSGGSSSIAVGAASYVGGSTSQTNGYRADVNDAVAAYAMGYDAEVDSGLTAAYAFGRLSHARLSNQVTFGGESATYYFDKFNIGNGTISATPIASVNIYPTGGSGTNISATDLDLSGGAATGTGTGGAVSLRTSQVGTTGTTAQTWYDRLVVEAGSDTGEVYINTSTNAEAPHRVRTAFGSTGGAGDSAVIMDIELPTGAADALCWVELRVCVNSDDADYSRYIAIWDIYTDYDGGWSSPTSTARTSPTPVNPNSGNWTISAAESGGNLRITCQDPSASNSLSTMNWNLTAFIKKNEGV